MFKQLELTQQIVLDALMRMKVHVSDLSQINRAGGFIHNYYEYGSGENLFQSPCPKYINPTYSNFFGYLTGELPVANATSTKHSMVVVHDPANKKSHLAIRLASPNKDACCRNGYTCFTISGATEDVNLIAKYATNNPAVLERFLWSIDPIFKRNVYFYNDIIKTPREMACSVPRPPGFLQSSRVVMPGIAV